MKNLVIEVNNQNIKATIFTQANKTWELLYSQTYDFNDDWAQRLEKEVRAIDTDLFHNYSLIFNNSKTKIGVQRAVETTFKLDGSDAVEKIQNKIRSKAEGYVIVKNEFEILEVKSGKATGLVKYEMVDEEIHNSIVSILMQRGFSRMYKSESLIDTFETAIDKEGNVINLHIDTHSSFVIKAKEGKVVGLVKKNFAISWIYKVLAEKLDITEEKAMNLFKNYGSIPPTNVVDNRLIHSNGVIEVDKMMLSKLITTMIDRYIKGIEKDIVVNENIDVKVLYSGEILNLRGAEKYITTSLGLTNSRAHESQIFGFDSLNNIVADGVIKMAKRQKEETEEKTRPIFAITQLFKR